jgi:RNA 3'-terminal phosphate cyclase (ATP)/RNA 3'-terminal phosphate cyclase (GTP)
MIEIDGSYGSGGGQVIRTAVGLSGVAGKPCKIINIRAGRPKPGLAAQHLKGIEAVAKLCNASLKGASLGSTEIEFAPESIESRQLDIDVGTAGSVTLVLQALLIPSIHAAEPTEFRITGGTHVKWSPTTGYFRHVFSEFMKAMGIDIKSETEQYGYFPKGGGQINVTVTPPKSIKPINITERGKHILTEAWSNASRDLIKPGVCERQTKGAERWTSLDKRNSKYVPSDSTGSSITIAAAFENCWKGASALGERGKSAELVGEEAGKLLQKELDSKATVDRHMADQILPYMALAAPNGPSTVITPRITDHVKTNIWVIEKFLPVKFRTEEISGGVKITCSS